MNKTRTHKHRIKISALMVYCVLSLSACQQQASQLYTADVYVFGTLVNISIWHQDSEQANTALTAIETHFNNMHRYWHAWKPGRLQNINQALRNHGSVILNAEEQLFFKQVIELSIRSGHTFNPAIGELINLWGFHTDDYPITSPPPDVRMWQQVAAYDANMGDLTIEANVLKTANAHVWLDFGGIAKGLAVDQAIDILHTHGIENAIVNAGGDLRSIGSKQQKPWRIAIQTPGEDSVLATLEVQKDEAIFTSGNYYRYKEFDGQRYPHIIDGRTGQPVTGISSATVVAANGILADAAATALIVAGPKQWLTTATTMGIQQALVIDDQGVCHGTSDMLNRLQNIKKTCVIANQ
ncbi:FAD:protein FMN transferase [Marinicella sp. W31]|uniref:FAD:protein FMN transferase n=1 Tax=Marinicella sp. W31 TaxID=3023713 RepID=UPI00375662E5